MSALSTAFRASVTRPIFRCRPEVSRRQFVIRAAEAKRTRAHATVGDLRWSGEPEEPVAQEATPPKNSVKKARAQKTKQEAAASTAVLAETRERAALMSSDAEQSALNRQYGAPSGAAEEVEEASPYEPCQSYADGTFLYTEASLGAVNYEDVLSA